MLEYSAGLLRIAQPLYVIKLLKIAFEIIESAEKEEWIENEEKNIANKQNILTLTGPCARPSPIVADRFAVFGDD